MKVKIKKRDPYGDLDEFMPIKITLQNESELMLFYDFIGAIPEELAEEYGVGWDNSGSIVKAFGVLEKALEINNANPSSYPIEIAEINMSDR